MAIDGRPSRSKVAGMEWCAAAEWYTRPVGCSSRAWCSAYSVASVGVVAVTRPPPHPRRHAGDGVEVAARRDAHRSEIAVGSAVYLEEGGVGEIGEAAARDIDDPVGRLPDLCPGPGLRVQAGYAEPDVAGGSGHRLVPVGHLRTRVEGVAAGEVGDDTGQPVQQPGQVVHVR